MKPATCMTEPKTKRTHKLWMKHASTHANELNTKARINFGYVHQRASMQASMHTNKRGSKLTSKTAANQTSTHTDWQHHQHAVTRRNIHVRNMRACTHRRNGRQKSGHTGTRTQTYGSTSTPRLAEARCKTTENDNQNLPKLCLH